MNDFSDNQLGAGFGYFWVVDAAGPVAGEV
jgi:hypothetical protein